MPPRCWGAGRSGVSHSAVGGGVPALSCAWRRRAHRTYGGACRPRRVPALGGPRQATSAVRVGAGLHGRCVLPCPIRCFSLGCSGHHAAAQAVVPPTFAAMLRCVRSVSRYDDDRWRRPASTVLRHEQKLARRPVADIQPREATRLLSTLLRRQQRPLQGPRFRPTFTLGFIHLGADRAHRARCPRS